jgi:hypothetical protein
MARKYLGWAYVSGSADEGADGPIGAVQYKYGAQLQTGSHNFTYITGSDSLFFTGSIYVSGTVISDNYDVINHTVSYLSASGASKFGDDATDLHQFTGSVAINGPLSASTTISCMDLSASSIYLNDDHGATIIHAGDHDTYLDFGTNTVQIYAGGDQEINANSTGVGIGGATPIDGLAVTAVISASAGITGSSFVTDGHVLAGTQVSASAGITGSSFVTDGQVSASTFHGDGSNLTGITAGGAGGLFTAVNGSNAYITSSVRVGTSGTPGYPLEVSGTINITSSFPISGGSVLLRGNGTAILGIEDGNTNVRIGSGDSGKTLSFYCGNPPEDPAMRLTDAGRLGVGTTSASHEIHVVADNSPTIRVEDNRNLVQTDLYSSTTQGAVGTNSNHTFSIMSNNTSALSIDTNQNVTCSGGNFLVPDDNIAIGLPDGVEPSGTLHVQVGQGAGVAPHAYADDFVLALAGTAAGMSILNDDSNACWAAMGHTSDNITSAWNDTYSTKIASIGTHNSNYTLKLLSGNGTTTLTLDPSNNVTCSAGNFLVPDDKIGIGLPAGVEPSGSLHVQGGYVRFDTQPSFSVYANTNQTTVNADHWMHVSSNVEHYDVGGGYNTTTCIYTAPQTGTYMLTATTRMDSVNAGGYLWTYIETTDQGYFGDLWSEDDDATGYGSPAVTIITQMTAGDTAKVFVKATNNTANTNASAAGYVMFQGHMLG